MSVARPGQGPDVVTVGEAMVAFRSDCPAAQGGTQTTRLAGSESNVAIGLARLGPGGVGRARRGGCLRRPRAARAALRRRGRRSCRDRPATANRADLRHPAHRRPEFGRLPAQRLRRVGGSSSGHGRGDVRPAPDPASLRHHVGPVGLGSRECDHAGRRRCPGRGPRVARRELPQPALDPGAGPGGPRPPVRPGVHRHRVRGRARPRGGGARDGGRPCWCSARPRGGARRGQAREQRRQPLHDGRDAPRHGARRHRRRPDRRGGRLLRGLPLRHPRRPRPRRVPAPRQVTGAFVASSAGDWEGAPTRAELGLLHDHLPGESIR